MILVKSLDADGSPKEKRRKGTGKITLTEVAEFVGVSAMTVSRALRMPEKVNPELRDRIDAAVSQLGYDRTRIYHDVYGIRA